MEECNKLHERTCTSNATDISDQTRRGRLREIKLGLAPYLTATTVARYLDVVYIGLSDRFGSKFNNIVNPRLGELN